MELIEMSKIRCKLCGKEIIESDYCEECKKNRNEYLKTKKEEENDKVIEQTNINNDINTNEIQKLLALDSQKEQK